jgi:hypothetical protein
MPRRSPQKRLPEPISGDFRRLTRPCPEDTTPIHGELVMIRIILSSVILVSTLALSGCGDDKVAFQYQYVVDDCDTGSHRFTSKEEICSGLQNDSLNRGCAREERKLRFEEYDCPGDWRD